jgi:hypothetical protein
MLWALIVARLLIYKDSMISNYAAAQFQRSEASLKNFKSHCPKEKRESMKKTISITLALALAVLLITADSAAQTRIRFRRGSSSATVSGTIGVNRGIAGANYRTYVLRANPGQTISVAVSGILCN